MWSGSAGEAAPVGGSGHASWAATWFAASTASPSRSATTRTNPTVLACQLVGVHAQRLCRARDERKPCVRARLTDRHRALLDRSTPCRQDFVRGGAGRGTLDVDERRINAELVGRHGGNGRE